MRRIFDLIKFIRIIPIILCVNWKDEKLLCDLDRWKRIYNINVKSKSVLLAILMGNYKEFRNLFLYRNQHRRFYRYWVRCWYKPMETLYIYAKEIGGGLFIQHGFATMISAEKIGKNCWINQQVTIGYNGEGKAPVIEDNVMITCGAKVLGEINVGAGAIIGANAVVIKDVEPNAVMVGIPARKIR